MYAISHCVVFNQLRETNITARYQGVDIVFLLWRIKAWDWCKSLLDDPALQNEFRWDAERVFRHNGQEFERFFNKLWTANRWWKVQVSVFTHLLLHVVWVLMVPQLISSTSCRSETVSQPPLSV